MLRDRPDNDDRVRLERFQLFLGITISIIGATVAATHVPHGEATASTRVVAFFAGGMTFGEGLISSVLAHRSMRHQGALRLEDRPEFVVGLEFPATLAAVILLIIYSILSSRLGDISWTIVGLLVSSLAAQLLWCYIAYRRWKVLKGVST